MVSLSVQVLNLPSSFSASVLPVRSPQLCVCMPNTCHSHRPQAGITEAELVGDKARAVFKDLEVQSNKISQVGIRIGDRLQVRGWAGTGGRCGMGLRTWIREWGRTGSL